MSKAILGLGFGDEGKGRAVSYFCSKSPTSTVARFSGGHQCGHQVFLNKDLVHVFSHFGSGTLQGVPTYWSKFCTVDPVNFINEFNELKSKGITPKIYINPKCPVTTMYDKEYNREQEVSNQHGSCGLGFGSTIEREENHISFLFEDIWNNSIVNIKLNQIFKYYCSKMKSNPNVTFAKFLDACDEIKNLSNILLSSAELGNHHQVIYEGSQGLLLDKDIGFFPHVTRSNTSTKNISKSGLADIPDEYVLVTRAYQTRHGNGPMTNEDKPHNIKENPYGVNIYNSFQGHFRKSLLDIDLLKYAIMKDPHLKDHDNKSLFITCLDLVENEWRFTLNGEIIGCLSEEEFVAKIAKELHIQKLYLSRSPISTEVEERLL